MSDSHAADRLVIPTRVVARAIGTSTVLLNVETGRYFTLDEIGTRAWAVLTRSPSLQAAYDTLLAEYAAEPDVLRRDLDDLVASLREAGLIEVARA
jgi:hypothetical protein